MKQVQDKTLESKEGIFNRSIKNKTLVEFNGQTVTAAEYFPVWLNNLADDVTLEGTFILDFVQGPEDVRAIVKCIRKIYEQPGIQLCRPLRRKHLLRKLHWLGSR
jgi:hypothetical protein